MKPLQLSARAYPQHTGKGKGASSLAVQSGYCSGPITRAVLPLGISVLACTRPFLFCLWQQHNKNILVLLQSDGKWWI